MCGHVTCTNIFILMFSLTQKQKIINYFIKLVIYYRKTYVWFKLHLIFYESLDLLNTN